MEGFRVTLDDGSGKEFDAVLKDSLQDEGLIRLITKDEATAQGNPAVMLTFRVALPDGTFRRVQTVTTAKLFLSAARVIGAKYPDLLL